MSNQDEEAREETREERFARLRALPFPLPLGDEAGGDGEAPPPIPAAAAAEEPATAPEPQPVIEYTATCMEVSVPLQFPFTIDDQPVSVIRLLPPTFGDVEAVLTGRMSEIEMIGRMARVPVAAMRALRWSDAEKVTAIARILMPAVAER